MKNNKKLGQALIEYVLLLVIPLLVISVLPELNQTVELTLNTVGVDLLEEDGVAPESNPPISTCDTQPELCKILYPPVAKMELPTDEDCSEKGIYRKGATIRIQDTSYDTDPLTADGKSQGAIDHTEWTVVKHNPNGAIVPECSTTTNNKVIKISRSYSAGSQGSDYAAGFSGLTIDMNGYGGLTEYRNCVRDPGTFTVTIKAFDNDGLLSPNTDIQTFEILDLKPSISLSVKVAQNAMLRDGSSDEEVLAKSLSNRCAFAPKPGNGIGADPIIETSTTTSFTYDGLDYYYTEVCPKNGRSTGKVTFSIKDLVGNNSNNNVEALPNDPDYVATNATDENEKIPEGATNTLYGYQRHGFHYRTRYIQSSALNPNNINSNNSQAILFQDGATEYVKEFENPGIYMYDAQVIDENLYSSQSNSVQAAYNNYSSGNYHPDIGVAIKVLSPSEPGYEEKCGDDDGEPLTISCPKPSYIMGITKTNSIDNSVKGPYYFSVGAVGKTAAQIQEDVNHNYIVDENGNSIKNSYYANVSELQTLLGIDVVAKPYSYTRNSSSTSVSIPVFRPLTDDHLDIKALTYHPSNTGSYTMEECADKEADDDTRFWATSNGWNNDFNFNTLTSGQNALWRQGENPGDEWFEIHRPYDEDEPNLYYNMDNIDKITKGFDLTIEDQPIDHVELIYGMARNHFLSSDAETFGSDILASPFDGAINNSSQNEPYSGISLRRTQSNEDGVDVLYENSYLRTNGQLIAIAPKTPSCPLHNQRPIPGFSYISNTDTIIDLSLATSGVADLNSSNITWSIDTKNPPTGISCTKEGCFVAITASNSVCGPDTHNCSIKAIRWQFSPYTHVVSPESYDLNTAFENATPTDVYNDDFAMYFPLTDKVVGEKHKTEYAKYENVFFPIANAVTRIYNTTIEDSYDTMYSLPVNNNSYGSYIYYGDYNGTTDYDNYIGEKRSSVPTFDFLPKTSTTSLTDLLDSGTVAPNGNQIYSDTDHPNILPENSSYGMFLDAGSTYLYTIEVIDSQGCATSRTLTITISDSAKEPEAKCNFTPIFDDHIVDFTPENRRKDKEKLAKYEYYGGLLVQARNLADGTQTIVYNGDNLDYDTMNDNAINLYTSPLYMFADTSDHSVNTNGSLIDRGDSSQRYLRINFNPESIQDQSEVPQGAYNPRVGQIAVNDTLAGILNADGSKLYEGATVSESRDVFNNASSQTIITWNLYKADFEVTLNANHGNYSTFEDYVSHLTELSDGVAGTMGTRLQKLSDTPIATVTTNNLSDSPNFPASAFSEPGYYMIEFTISYVKDGERLTSQSTECDIKVTTPTLDFKCPWGETLAELNLTRLEMHLRNNGTIEPSATIMSTLDDISIDGSNAGYTTGNKNSHITNFQFTFNINEDYNGLDDIESGEYNKAPLIDLSPGRLNAEWANVKLYGIHKDLEQYVICDGTDSSCNSSDNGMDALEDLFYYEGILLNDYGPNSSVMKAFNAVKNSPNLNPLTITINGSSETMSLQGWIVRERRTRNNEIYAEAQSLYVYNTDSGLDGTQLEEDIRLLHEPMSDEQMEIFDVTLRALGNNYTFPELYDIAPYKYKIATQLISSPHNGIFTFMDLQPGAVEHTDILAVDRVKNGWFNKYFGTYKTKNENNETVYTEVAGINSIRKGNMNTANNFGIFNLTTASSSGYVSSGRSAYTTPFMGKYDAARRFEALNYYNLINQYNPNINKNNLIHVYSLQKQENGVNYIVHNDTRGNTYNYKNYYINPFSVYLNNTGYINSTTDESVEPASLGRVTTDASLNPISANADSFTNLAYQSLPETLKANTDFLKTMNLYEYSIDRNTLNNVAYQHSQNLNLDGDEYNENNMSAITYVKVNSADVNTLIKKGNSTVPNNYSKLCPIKVDLKYPNSIDYKSCNISYMDSSHGTVYVPYNVPDNGDDQNLAGYMTNGSITLTADYLNNSPLTDAFSKYDTEYRDSIPAPKAYQPDENSVPNPYNMSDLLLNWSLEYKFIDMNKYENLYKVRYTFYNKGAYGDTPIIYNGAPLYIDLHYKLAESDTTTYEGISAIIDRVRDEFNTAWYIPGTDGRTRYSALFTSRSQTNSEYEKADNMLQFQYFTVSYKVEYYKSETELMNGNNSTSCSLAVAHEMPPNMPIGNQGTKFVLEIGSWHHRFEFPGATSTDFNPFPHWDRTYQYDYWKERRSWSSGKQFVQLVEPNASCKWISAPTTGKANGGVSAPYANGGQRLLFGGENDSNFNGGCIVAGTTPGSPHTSMTGKNEAIKAGIVTYYRLNPGNSYISEDKVGFYAVGLNLLPSGSLTAKEVENLCWRSQGDGRDIEVVDGSEIGERAGTKWCRGDTMYGLAGNDHKIGNLNGTQAIEVVVNNNGGATKDFRDALQAQIDRCYGKTC